MALSDQVGVPVLYEQQGEFNWHCSIVHFKMGAHGIKGCPLGRGNTGNAAYVDLQRRINSESGIWVFASSETYIDRR